MDGQQQGNNYYDVDIVMCIDATGSMAPVIEEVKRNALTLHQQFVDAMEEANKPVEKVRIKVIAFRDYGCDKEPMVSSQQFFTLPDENEAFQNFVNGIQADGGGDEAENSLEALALALKSDWTTSGQKRRHCIVLFTDAPALKLGERKDAAGYPSDMPADLPQLSAWYAGTDQSFSSSFGWGPVQRNAGRLFLFAPDADPWSSLAAWNQCWHVPSQAGKGLDGTDMQSVLDVMVASF